MDPFFRFFIKFYGYSIGMWCILGSLFLSFLIVIDRSFTLPLEEFYNFRFMGSSALIFGLAWFAVGAAMIYGVFKENTKCLYPMPILYMVELFMLLARDVVMVWRSEPSYKMAFLDPVVTLVILYVTLHILMSVVAMARLFQHEPSDQSVMDFRRLKADQDPEETDELQENNGNNAEE